MPAKPVLLMVRELGIGGAERDLAKVAIGLDRGRFAPHVACFRGDGIRAEDLHAAGVPILELPVRSFKSPSAIGHALRLRRYLREHRIGLVHTFDTPTNIFGVPAAKLAGVRVISSQLWLSAVIEQPSRRLVHYANRLADRIVVNSEAVRQGLIREEGFAAEKIFLNYNGIDPALFSRGPAQRPAEFGGASLIIGTMCVLRPEKRVDLLMRAFRRVYERHPEVMLMILGSGVLGESLDRLRGELGLRESCVMVPTQRDVTPWLRTMDIFALCSDSESFPNAVLESMACGCAVVGSRAGGIPELLVEGCGLLFDVGSEEQLVGQLMRLVEDARLREGLRRAAAERAKNEFPLRLVAERLGGLYDRVLANR